MATIRVIYENGVFRPLDPVPFPEGYVAGVHIPISLQPEFADEWTDPENNGEPLEDRLAREIQRLQNRTPEEIQRTRDEIMQASRPARPLPPGKTLEEVLREKWPENQPDECARDAAGRS